MALKNTREQSDLEFKNTLRTFGFFVNFGRRLHICPYRFDPKTEKMITERSPRYLIVALVSALLLLFYDVFLVVQCVRLHYNNEAPVAYKVRTFYITTVFLFWSSGVPLALSQFGSYTALFNGLMDLEKQIKAQHDFERGSKTMKRVFRAIVVFYLYALIVFPRDLVKKPDIPLLLTSILDKENRAWRKYLLPIWALHTYVGFVLMYNSFLTTMLLLLFVSTVTPAVELLRLRSNQKLRLSRGSVKWIFGRLAVLERVYASMLGPWTMLFVVTHVVCVIVCIYQWFIFRMHFTGVFGILFLTILTNFTRTCGGLFERNTQVIRSWRPLENDLAFGKWRKARRPLRVTIGSFFHFDARVMLTFMEIIVTNAASLILSSEYSEHS